MSHGSVIYSEKNLENVNNAFSLGRCSTDIVGSEMIVNMCLRELHPRLPSLERKSIGEIDTVLTPVSETEKQYYRLSGGEGGYRLPSSFSFPYLALYL